MRGRGDIRRRNRAQGDSAAAEHPRGRVGRAWAALRGSDGASIAPAPQPDADRAFDGIPVIDRPSLEEIGERGAYYLSRRRTWVRRHVETFEMTSDQAGVRRVTVDIVAPTDLEASFPWRDGKRLYYVPIGFIRKHKPVSKIDLRAEDGTALPMPNRIDNGRITIAALEHSSLARLPERHRAQMKVYLETLVLERDPDAQAIWLAQVFARAFRADPATFRDPAGKRMRQIWRDVATDSIVWVGLIAAPGQRRVIKFAHDVNLERPRLWPRRPRWRKVKYRLVGLSRQSKLFKIWDAGDYNSRGLLRRVWARVTTTIGWGAYDVAIPLPWVRHAQSYHFQFDAPPSLEVRGARLRCQLRDHDGNPTWPRPELSRERAHIYFADALVRREGPAEVAVRVGRRGFLSVALFTATAIAGILWFYAAHAGHKQLGRNPEVAAVVILVLPPLLAAFAVRPGEHSLAVRMLSGVRLALMLDGLLTAAAALSFAPARPFGWGTGTACHYYAVAATVIAAVLFISWLLALDFTEHARRASRSALRDYGWFRWIAPSPIVIAAISVALMSDVAGHHSLEHWLRLALLALLSLDAAWISTFWDANDAELEKWRTRQLIGLILGPTAGLLALAALLSGGYDLALVHWRDIRVPLLYVLIGVAVVLLSAERLRGLGIPRPLVEQEDDLIIDWQDTDEDNAEPTGAAGVTRAR